MTYRGVTPGVRSSQLEKFLKLKKSPPGVKKEKGPTNRKRTRYSDVKNGRSSQGDLAISRHKELGGGEKRDSTNRTENAKKWFG